MCTKIKVWKPGQLVTINHKVYRVVKNLFGGCANCENIHTNASDPPCAVCIPHKFQRFVGMHCGIILKELKPKQIVMAKQYKPGQFVWIDGKKHRVTKVPSTPVNIENKTIRVCDHCPYYEKTKEDCYLDSWICVLSLPQDCYPKPV